MTDAEKCAARGERVSRLEEGMTDLVRWQKSQNGSIHRVEDATIRLNEKVDKVYHWLLGAVFMVAVNCIGVIVMLLSK